MVDCVKLSQLGEKATIGNILPDTAPELDPLAPVVAPVIETARLEAVRPGQITDDKMTSRPTFKKGLVHLLYI